MENKIQIKNNAFDYIRYYAALSVMLLHYTGYARIFSDQGKSVLSIVRDITLFFPGVVILFALSGFLISASREHTPDSKLFFRKRILRLFPELWVCTLFNLLLLTILVFDRFDKSILVWTVTQIFGIANTPSCLKDFATGSVNGALWTIFVELQCYLLILFTYHFLQKLSLRGWCILLMLCAFVNLLAGRLASILPSFMQKLLERTLFPYVIWFLIGVFCYTKRAILLPLLKKYCPLLFVIYLFLYIADIFQYGYYCSILISLLCPFIIIGLAYLLPAIRIKTDLSYGMFLYHWIVLNLLVHFNLFNKLPWLVCLILFIASTLVLSWCSTTFIGKAVRSRAQC